MRKRKEKKKYSKKKREKKIVHADVTDTHPIQLFMYDYLPMNCFIPMCF